MKTTPPSPESPEPPGRSRLWWLIAVCVMLLIVAVCLCPDPFKTEANHGATTNAAPEKAETNAKATAQLNAVLDARHPFTSLSGAKYQW